MQLHIAPACTDAGSSRVVSGCPRYSLTLVLSRNSIRPLLTSSHDNDRAIAYWARDCATRYRSRAAHGRPKPVQGVGKQILVNTFQGCPGGGCDRRGSLTDSVCLPPHKPCISPGWSWGQMNCDLLSRRDKRRTHHVGLGNLRSQGR